MKKEKEKSKLETIQCRDCPTEEYRRGACVSCQYQSGGKNKNKK